MIDATLTHGTSDEVSRGRGREEQPGQSTAPLRVHAPHLKQLEHLGREALPKRSRIQPKQSPVDPIEHKNTRFAFATCKMSASARVSSSSARVPSGVMW